MNAQIAITTHLILTVQLDILKFLAIIVRTVEQRWKEVNMKMIDNRTIYRLALSTYGSEAQTLMMFEEMAELQKELCKEARGEDNTDAIAEEIADVKIMLEQMTILHNCKDMVEIQMKRKLQKLKERLEGEEW